MLRRIAALMVLTFIAGPAMKFDCFVSCAIVSGGTSADTCHNADHDAIAAHGQPCTDDHTQVSVFVKTTEPRLWVITAAASGSVDSAAVAPERSRRVSPGDLGPPHARAVIPLRI